MAGVRTAAFCEKNAFCRSVLRERWPDIPIFDDVRELTKEVMISAGVPPIELIHWGFPCQ
jgi:DNA (cytosine-5)-methyltransferase 1